jgi:hypothetical protein
VVEEYEYHDKDGEVVMVVERREPKGFFQKRPNPDGDGFLYNLQGVVRVPYRLPEVLAAVESGDPVWIVEGEKDADALRAWGLTATTNAGGAGKWDPTFAAYFAGADVRIVPDNDKPGREHAEAVARSLTSGRSKAATVKVIDLPVAEKGDVSDWIASGGTRASLEALVDESPEWSAGTALPTRRQDSDDGDSPNLAAVLDAVMAFMARFVVLPSRHAAVACTLWVAHTHAWEGAYATPYIHVHSAESESGKSRLKRVLKHLAHKSVTLENVSVAGLYTALQEKPTLFIDEIDSIFGKNARSEKSEELRSILNAGFEYDGKVLRATPTKGGRNEAVWYEVFGPKMLVGIGQIPPTLRSRSVSIHMQRRKGDEKVDHWRARSVIPQAKAIHADLRNALMAVQVNGYYDGEMPSSLEDREQDQWEPLFEIAALASPEWLADATEAAVALSGAQRSADDEDTLGVLLLKHVREVFGERERLHTRDLLQGLHSLEDAPWGEMNGQKLAWRLSLFDIRPKQIRIGAIGRKGYERADLEDPWERYCPLPPEIGETSETSETSLATQGFSGGDEPKHEGKQPKHDVDPEAKHVSDDVSQKPLRDNGCFAVSPVSAAERGVGVGSARKQIDHDQLHLAQTDTPSDAGTDTPTLDSTKSSVVDQEGDRLHCLNCGSVYAYFGLDRIGHCAACDAESAA